MNRSISSINPPTVVKISRKGGEIIQNCDVYIGRRWFLGGWKLEESPFHNPFPVKTYGIEKSLEKYEKYLRNSPELIEMIPELNGKRLGCWCKPGKCHGDIIVKIFHELV